MTPIKKQKGFTIVEVILFLAVTGLFILIAFQGMASRSENSRLADSIRSLEFFINSEATSIRNGVNSSPGATGGDITSVFLGKMYHPVPGQNRIEIYTIKGAKIPTAGREGDPVDQLIRDSSPIVDSASPALRYEVEWGLTLKQSYTRDISDAHVGYYGFLLNPATGLQSVIVMEQDIYTGVPANDLGNATNYLRKSGPVGQAVLYDNDQNLNLRLCYVNEVGRVSEVTLGEGALGPIVQSKFDNNVYAPCLI